MMRRSMPDRRGALLFAMALVVVCAGWGLALERDPAKGEYYTNEEITKLSSSESAAYCEAMERTLQDLQEETATYQSRLDSMQVMADTLRAQTLALSDSIRQVNNDLRELRLKRKTVTTLTTKGGETLAHLAKMLFGDANRAQDFLDANQAALAGKGLEDPLPAGVSLKVPR